MVTDPYSVLGISKDATPEEIKKAYRKKAKEYHPDLHPDDPNASKKMNEVNEAYDMITNPSKYTNRTSNSTGYGNSNNTGASSASYRNTGSQSSGGYYYRGPGGWSSDFGFDFDDFFNFGGQTRYETGPAPQAGDSPEVLAAIQLILSDRHREAIEALAKIPGAYRNARWYYLNAIAHYGAGYQVMALDYIQRACRLDPNNPVYIQLNNKYRMAGRTYQQNASTYTKSPVNWHRICIGFILAQLFCGFGRFFCCFR